MTALLFGVGCDKESPAAQPGSPQGQVRCTAGDVKPADDGCNSCVCDDGGAWACTEKACLPASECTPGAQKTAEDGCNSCFCTDDGRWACTRMACPDPVDGECRENADCAPAGCSGQLCAPKNAADGVVTTCEWRDEYACYRAPTTACSCLQGRCGWKQTAELAACLGQR